MHKETKGNLFRSILGFGHILISWRWSVHVLMLSRKVRIETSLIARLNMSWQYSIHSNGKSSRFQFPHVLLNKMNRHYPNEDVAGQKEETNKCSPTEEEIKNQHDGEEDCNGTPISAQPMCRDWILSLHYKILARRSV